jgi:hypothetical protein
MLKLVGAMTGLAFVLGAVLISDDAEARRRRGYSRATSPYYSGYSSNRYRSRSARYALSGGGSGYYANCSAVRAAGAAPVRVGDLGYSRRLDRDGDGVGCE